MFIFVFSGRLRACVNIYGDAVGCAIIQALMEQSDPPLKPKEITHQKSPKYQSVFF